MVNDNLPIIINEIINKPLLIYGFEIPTSSTDMNH